jgi:hypothetical protein
MRYMCCFALPSCSGFFAFSVYMLCFPLFINRANGTAL